MKNSSMRMLQLVAGLWLTPWLLACATAPVPPTQLTAVAEAVEVAPTQRACPSGLPTDTRCLGGQDSAGAFYLIAMPLVWTGVLVLHAHGGPELGAPKLERSAEDLTRWAIMVKAGHAWAGSTFRQGGVAVRAAAQDTERLRQIFVAHVAKPKQTILHGQSWGAGVAAKAAEMYAGTDVATAAGTGVGPDRKTPVYDGVLLSSGVLGGGTLSYDFRLDLRVVYQYLCSNHPLPQEPQYPLWTGLPPGSTLTRADLAQRADACLGLRQPAAQRSAEQQQRLQTLLRVIRIPERSVLGHLNWATWHFQDVVQKRTGGLNPWGNIGAQYSGSADDAALNAAVLRYRADPAAVASFGLDSDPSGRIRVPVLGVHAVHDPVAFVELEAQFRRTMRAAGQAGHLVQTFTDDHEHSYLSNPVYPALIDELLAWTQDATRQPTPQSVAARCQALQARFGSGCRFLPDYQPAELETRVSPRQRP